MERITWIIIWLIVVAILVELGEIIARLAVHTTTRSGGGGKVTTFFSVLATHAMSAFVA